MRGAGALLSIVRGSAAGAGPHTAWPAPWYCSNDVNQLECTYAICASTQKPPATAGHLRGCVVVQNMPSAAAENSTPLALRNTAPAIIVDSTSSYTIKLPTARETTTAAGHLRGSFMLQNLPSIAAALALAPAPGARVIDMCAAPGGKSTMLAQIMDNEGEIISVDRSHNKVRLSSVSALGAGRAWCAGAAAPRATPGSGLAARCGQGGPALS